MIWWSKPNVPANWGLWFKSLKGKRIALAFYIFNGLPGRLLSAAGKDAEAGKSGDTGILPRLCQRVALASEPCIPELS